MRDIASIDADIGIEEKLGAAQAGLVNENQKYFDVYARIREQKKVLHGAEQKHDDMLIASTRERIAALEKELQAIEKQKQAYKDRIDLILYGRKVTEKDSASPESSSSSKSEVEVLDSDFEKYGVKSSRRLVEIYKTEEQALERLVSLLKERNKHEEGSDQHSKLTTDIAEASKALESSHWSLLRTKAGKAYERTPLLESIAHQATQAIDELNKAGIQIEQILSRITHTTKTGFANATNGVLGVTKRDHAALQDAIFGNQDRRRGSRSSASSEKKEENELTEIEQKVKAITDAMDLYNKKSGDMAKYHSGSKKMLEAEEARKAALQTIRTEYDYILNKLPEGEAKTKAIASIMERLKKIQEEISARQKKSSHKDKSAEEAKKAVEAAKKQKESLPELEKALSLEQRSEANSDKPARSRRSPRRRTPVHPADTDASKKSDDASRKAADSKEAEKDAQDKLNDSIQEGTR